MRRGRIRIALALALTLGGAAVLSSMAVAPAQSLQPLEVDWEEIFRLTWQVSERSGRPLISGKIHNISVYGTNRIQLLVDQLDGGGRTVAQQIAWLGVNIKAGDHAFFDVPVAERAAAYRVRVFAFTRKFGTTDN